MPHCRPVPLARDQFSAPVACKPACRLSGPTGSLPGVSLIVALGEPS
jgi:hypothetical protein